MIYSHFTLNPNLDIKIIQAIAKRVYPDHYLGSKLTRLGYVIPYLYNAAYSRNLFTDIQHFSLNPLPNLKAFYTIANRTDLEFL